ncbi:EamA family transporter [Caloramator sp. E03]|uniref:DMT family transporter n=1 Tax=Caloramator sp. E03 TaxID=2576307 RepID=UPI0011101CD7|nr:EamA family transporter [Caloramator sp. E03]QCX33571.1 EamA family transporter [Caloramator sp. E03]
MKKGYIYIFLSAFIFSTMEIVSKLISNKISPYELTFIRFLIGGLILLPFSIKEIKNKKIKIDFKSFLYFAFTGFLCVSISMIFFQLAIIYTKASTVAVIFSTNPIFTLPFAYFILKEKFNIKTILSMVLCIIGVIIIFNPFSINPDIIGIILSLFAAIAFSLYSVIGRLKIDTYGSTTLTCFSFLIGDILLLILLLIFKVPIREISSDIIPHIIYLGIIVTGLGYLLYFAAIKETSVVISSIVFFIKPALAPILSFILLKEEIPLNTIIGIGFILIGAYIMILSKKKAYIKS